MPPPAARSLRLLFLSDTHLGLDLPRRPRVAGPRRGQHHFESFERALAPARAGEVDAVLHGGDLLYRSRVPAALSEAALAPLRALAAAGLPVLLVPGNHERGRLPHPLLGRQEGLHVFDRPRTVVLAAGGLTVAFTRKGGGSQREHRKVSISWKVLRISRYCLPAPPFDEVLHLAPGGVDTGGARHRQAHCASSWVATAASETGVCERVRPDRAQPSGTQS